ncbi:protein DOUBLE-STRAND BREAK FORMATION isoform X2 [Macadamia integrifolia]|uniref:protein DOUBLE-STRAND BREAK FORMATION isoform X2 n=1 Tax=Macadamia integrifolia TaxID=60698 RepID=UPI001C529A09|nr:protein DOUBLE-STRAND BREAK FORMATION isoform X2 [Macadamia integrifolia]XP_042478407.1 protein DOUBLE-STRAND BREAK FORMATION isoform X2 [Macadamia integrifolia]
MCQVSGTVAERTSLFRSQVENRRLNEGTLQILESVLTSKDVKSLLEIRSCLSEFVRSELAYILQEIAEKTVEQKLSVLEFFVRTFALVGHVESCLMLRYEALILRQHKSTTHLWLHVSYEEWLAFAERSLNNGFYSIAVKVM